MKVVVDNRPKTNNNEASTAIRLFPETNEEMAQLEWIKQVCFEPKGFKRVCNNGMSYVVTFNQGQYVDNA